MNDKYPYGLDSKNYNGDYLNNVNQEVTTSKNLETIERLFDEWDDEDKSSDEAFSLDSQGFDSSLTYNKDTSPTSFNEPLESVDSDPLDKTREIDSVDLEELKALQAELHRLYDEQPEAVNEGASQSKGKALTKATKQGIAFSNGSLTRTFLDCAVLCFVTAGMGFAFIMNIINHI